MRLPLLLVLALSAASPAFAGSTAWQEFAPDTRVRIITSDVRASDGTVMAAIELDMPGNTKTYWRVPGETGIPTRLDFAGSQGVGGHKTFWPIPAIEEKEGFTDYVYYGPITIPFSIETTSDTPVIKASLLMGICSDICVPAMTEFELALDLTKPDPGSDIRIAQALANVPIPWDGSGDPVPGVTLDPAGGQLLVRVDLGALDPLSIVADAGDTGYLLGAPQKSREEGLVALPLIGDGDGADLVDKSIKLVFMTNAGPYEISRVIGRSTQP